MLKETLLISWTALALVLGTPATSSAHGTERHYGDPLGKQRASPPSVAFSLLVVESSLSSLRRGLEREDGGKVGERTRRLRRAALDLVTATTHGEPPQSLFSNFATALDQRAEDLVSASQGSRWATALSDLDALETSFRDATFRFKERESRLEPAVAD